MQRKYKQMSRRLFAWLMALAIGITVAQAADKRFTLVIDAGHGGHDAGAVGAKSKEKDINLNVALAFGKYVEEGCKDVKVVYTRKKDEFIALKTRANIANRNNADLFISIHTNALPSGKIARGFETYTLGMHRAKDNLDVAIRENSVISMEKGYQQTYEGFDPNSSESYIMFEFMQDKNMERSVELASMIQKSVCSTASRPDKGVHQAGFLVLRETSMPSCLIELGFITTPDEENALNKKSTVDAMARGIYQAFLKYKKKYDTSNTVTYTVEKPAKEESKKETKSKTSTAKEEKVKESAKAETSDPSAAPIFKVQIMACDSKLSNDDRRLLGEKDCEYYKEGNLYKYTKGASTDYNEINRLRKSLLEKFPQAFIIAFKNGEKYDVNTAIKEFKNNK